MNIAVMYKAIRVAAVAALFVGFCLFLAYGPVHAQSLNVAVIDSTTAIYGGSFPTTTSGPTGDLNDFSFTNLPVPNVNAANLASFDTILLNMASPGMGCNAASLSAGQKTDLVNFVAGGGKLIIYDSECSAIDYSWLPYPFTTANPGQLGATGTLFIVEDNVLSHTDGSDPHYVDAVSMATDTDAVGDMNVATTFDPNWCLDMSGINAIPAEGPVHIYARYQKGLIIWNGLDVDYMSSNTAPDSATAPGNIAKVWLQELQVAFNPTPFEDLPCGITVVGIKLDPENATNEVGQTHTVTATLKDLFGVPQPGILVTFSVISGPNVGAAGASTTDTNGQTRFSYVGSGGVGIDEIEACFINEVEEEICSNVVTKEWTPSAVPVGGNRPEFDAVGCDATNYFAVLDPIKQMVIANALNGFGQRINHYSDFPEMYDYNPFEFFYNTAGQLYPDPCFPNYMSALTDVWNEAVYEWQIVLQMKPESDIDLNVVDCVLKHNEDDIWNGAEQSGRYRAPWGQLFFVPTANPSLTVQAMPGEFATPGFASAFTMDARIMPGLCADKLDEALYTSKALWEEGIVMVLPETGATNASGETVYNLKQGDAIKVTVAIPGNNTADIRYGKDNVILKYIGIIGTEYVADERCPQES